MTGLDWAVLAGGALAIAWVNAHFFLARRRPAEGVRAEDGVQEVTIVVDGGYAPSEVRVRRGGPVRIVFDRKDTSSCTEEVLLPTPLGRRFLPAGRRTAVEFVPASAGRFEFTCGMGMLRGAILVEEPAEAAEFRP